MIKKRQLSSLHVKRWSVGRELSIFRCKTIDRNSNSFGQWRPDNDAGRRTLIPQALSLTATPDLQLHPTNQHTITIIISSSSSSGRLADAECCGSYQVLGVMRSWRGGHGGRWTMVRKLACWWCWILYTGSLVAGHSACPSDPQSVADPSAPRLPPRAPRARTRSSAPLPQGLIQHRPPILRRSSDRPLTSPP